MHSLNRRGARWVAADAQIFLITLGTKGKRELGIVHANLDEYRIFRPKCLQTHAR
jgi:hypothetical protein